jgi:ABC-type uncharacterized transport system substrate-binding protein
MILSTGPTRRLVLAGAAFLLPRVAMSDPTGPRRIGYLVTGTRASSEISTAAFREVLRGLGYGDQDVAMEIRYADGHVERLSGLAAELVGLAPEVIVAPGATATRAAKAATTTIPIVMGGATDPVGTGLIASLAHPGGNITGVAGDAGVEFYAKHLELVRQVIPSAVRVAYLTPRAVWESATLLTPVKDAAKEAGISLIPALLDAPIEEAEYRRVFAALAETRVDALIVGDSAEHYSQQRLIIDLAEHARLPAVYPGRIFVERGGLISYGAEGADLVRRRASDVARILNGAKPGDIPFYQATRFELVINLKTATALGLTISPTLLARADEIIE